MADTPSSENTTPTVDQAPRSDTTPGQNSGDTVQLAAAHETVQLAAAHVVGVGPGAASVAVAAGQAYQLTGPVLRFSQDGANLVIHWPNGAHTTLVGYFSTAPAPALMLADGTVLPFDQLIAQIDGFDPGLFAIEPPAARRKLIVTTPPPECFPSACIILP